MEKEFQNNTTKKPKGNDLIESYRKTPAKVKPPILKPPPAPPPPKPTEPKKDH